jgi:hypothetical protein
MKKIRARIKKTGKTSFVFPVKSAAENIHSPFMEENLHCD